MGNFFDVFKPVVGLWEVAVKHPLEWLLGFIYSHLQGLPVVETIGSYGVAIIVLTLIIRLALAPLQQFQLVTSRRSMVEQRKLAPQIAEIRKKYKNDREKVNTETMKLYKEHGVNPLSGMIGCLPLIVQIPILTALYYVLTEFTRSHHIAAHFLFVPNLNENPIHHPIFTLLGLHIPSPEYLVFPLLAALTTLVQSRMLQLPPNPNASEQELQAQQMQRTMVWLSPLMIGYFAMTVPAGLGLYWFVGNCVSIIQQSFVVGWGNVLPAQFKRTVAGGSGRKDSTMPKKGPDPGPKKGPGNGSKNGPGNGSKPKRPKRKR
ncbi:MAG TPA: YidC/Oxa1 family membrane protein insertase [Candidatus Dormibacteraeota bacterium]|nr:YidC/Oxa1 family membrane protein insertase [Candidatus Dormibacteraeota bacterium]